MSSNCKFTDKIMTYIDLLLDKAIKDDREQRGHLDLDKEEFGRLLRSMCLVHNLLHNFLDRFNTYTKTT